MEDLELPAAPGCPIRIPHWDPLLHHEPHAPLVRTVLEGVSSWKGLQETQDYRASWHL